MESANPYTPPRSDLPAGLDGSATPYRLAGIGARFGARVIDYAVEVSPVLVGSTLMVATGTPEQPNLLAMMFGYVGYLAIWIYQVVRLVKTGQTLGRKWLGLRIVRLDGGTVSFGSHLLRGLVFVFLWWIGVWFIFRQDRRTLHDLAAETRVIEV